MYKLTALLAVSYTQVADSALRGGKGRTQSILSSSSSNEQHDRSLQVVSGECTVDNFASFVGGKVSLASLLGLLDGDSVPPDDVMQDVLDTKCAEALSPQIDLSDTIGKGPQFLKNFLDGGTTWNDNYEENGYYKLSQDADVIDTVDAKSSVFATPDGGTSAYYPKYFSNFFHKGGEECPLGVIECCYTGSREPAANPFVANAEMCALDMTGAAQSNHIKARSMTYYDANSSDQAYCTGFAYEKDSFGDAVKYNTLFHLAMETNLKEKALVKNIPGAPLCGCVEQMPIVDNADCVKAVEGYTIDSNGDVKVNVTWAGCNTDLASYYDSLDRTKSEKYFVNKMIVGSGQCPTAAASFMNDHMLVSA